MQTQTLSVRGLIKKGWHTFTERPWFYAGSLALMVIIVILAQIIFGSLNSFIATVLLYICSIWLKLGYVRFYLNATEAGKHASIKDYFMEYRPILWLRYFVASIVVGLATFVGFILLIVPGIYLAIRFSFFQYALVDKQETIFGSIKYSWNATKGHTWKIFLFGIVGFFVMLVGLMLLGVGFLIAAPVVTLAFTHMYRELSEARHVEAAPATSV